MPNTKFMQNFGNGDAQPAKRQRSVPPPAAGDVDPFQLMYNSSVPQEDDDDDEIYGNLQTSQGQEGNEQSFQSEDDQVLSAAQRKLDERLGGILSRMEGEPDQTVDHFDEPVQQRQSPALGRVQGLAEELPPVPNFDMEDGYSQGDNVQDVADVHRSHADGAAHHQQVEAAEEHAFEEEEPEQGEFEPDQLHGDESEQPVEVTMENIHMYLEPLPEKPVKKPGRQSAAYMQGMREFEAALEARRERLSELGFGMTDEGEPVDLHIGHAKVAGLSAGTHSDHNDPLTESIPDSEVAEVILDYVCKQTVLNLKSTYTSQIYTKDYMEALMQGYVDGNVDHTNPLFKQLVTECIEHAEEDPYLKGMTKLVLKWIQNN